MRGVLDHELVDKLEISSDLSLAPSTDLKNLEARLAISSDPDGDLLWEIGGSLDAPGTSSQLLQSHAIKELLEMATCCL